MSNKIPAFSVTLDEKDITGKIAPRLISLTLTECRGDDADQLDLHLDDSDGKLAIPPRGAKIELQIGWIGGQLVNKGSFTVDEVEHSGAPDTITLRARTASLIDTFRQQQERSHHDTTLGEIIELIAFEHELKAGVAAPLRDVKIKHIDQTRESNAAFLRRMGKQYDAVATVKNDTLLFMPASASQTASGKQLPTIKIIRSLGDSHRFHSAERDSYSGVRAFWHDDKRAHRRSVIAGVPGNSKRLRTTFANEADARTAAAAEWQRIQRGLATFEMSLAQGNPSLMPQSPVVVSGFKPQIDEIDWLAVKITHSISGNGFTTQIEAETKTELEDTQRDIEMDPDEGITGVTAKWSDKHRKKQNKGQEQAGLEGNLKELPHTYASKQYAKRAAIDEWDKIKETRDYIKENSDQAQQ